MKSLVSVIVPSYNREELISETINSVLQQRYINWEMIIVDDGSSDNTCTLVKSFINLDKRIKIFYNKTNKNGANVCRNIGLKYAKGDYVVFLDSDDLLCSNSLQQRIDILHSNFELDFAVFQGVLFNSKNDEYSYWNIDTGNYLKNFFNFNGTWQTSGPIWKKKSLERYSLLWDENLSMWQDVDFHIMAILKNMKFKLFFEFPPDYYIRQDTYNSISHYDFNNPIKIASRKYFFNKYHKKICSKILPSYLQASLYSLLKTFSSKKDFKTIDFLLKIGITSKIINYHTYSKLRSLLFFNKIFNANLFFKKKEFFFVFETTIGKIKVQC